MGSGSFVVGHGCGDREFANVAHGWNHRFGGTGRECWISCQADNCKIVCSYIFGWGFLWCRDSRRECSC